MPTYKFTSPEGKTYKVTPPEGVTEQQAFEQLQQALGQGNPAPQAQAQSPAEPPPTPFMPGQGGGERTNAIKNLTIGDVIAGNPATRFATGAASPFIGMFQLGANAIGQGEPVNASIRNLKEMEERGKRLYSDPKIGEAGFRGPLLDLRVATDIAGSSVPEIAGTALSPAWLKAAKYMPVASGLLKRTGIGAAAGAAAGATAPSSAPTEDFWENKLAQTGGGALFGATIPPLAALGGKVAKVGYHGLVEPATLAGRDVIKGRELNVAAGDRRGAVVAALRRNRELVPGSRPTAGEAAAPAGSTEFAAMQARAREAAPSDYLQRDTEQAVSRSAAIGSVGRTREALKAAVEARKAVSDPLYRAARDNPEPISEDVLRPILKDVAALAKQNPGNRELVAEMKVLYNGLTARKKVVDPATGEEATKRVIRFTNPQQVISFIDGLKARMARKENAFILQELDGIKKRLVDAVPGYAEAQAAYAEASTPINQMQVGQHLQRTLNTALTDVNATPGQRAESYAAALRDAPKLIKRATGEPRAEKLTDRFMLTKDQAARVNAVADDLARRAEYELQARLGQHRGIDAARLAEKELERQAGASHPPTLLHRVMMATNTILRRFQGRANEQLEKELAQDMLNPQKTADLMDRAAELEAARRLADRIWNGRTQVPAIAGAVSASQQ